MVPFVVLLLTKDSDFIKHHVIQALVFQEIFYITYLIASFLCFVLINFLIIPILFITQLILTIITIIKTIDGEYYKYPIDGKLTGRL